LRKEQKETIDNLVSVVVATYNMGAYLPETLDSILAQDYPDLEIIVVDDGSTDETDAALAPYGDSPRVRVVKQVNQGQATAKNRGIAESRGRYVAFCDADDTWRADKLSLQVPCFAVDERTGVVFSDITHVDSEGNTLPRPEVRRVGGRITADLLVDNFIPFSSAIVERDILIKMGGFDERLAMSIDYELWLRISVDHLFHYVPEPLMNYRIWEGQMSHRKGKRLDNFFEMFERFLEKWPDAVTEQEKRIAWSHSLVTRGRWHASERRTREAWRDYRTAMSYHFQSSRLWKSVVRLFLGAK